MAEGAGDRVDHAVAVGEHETPGERADNRRNHQRQRDHGTEYAGSRERPVQRQSNGEAGDGFDDEAGGDNAHRLPKGSLEIHVSGDAKIVRKTDEIRDATERGVRPVDAQPHRPGDRVEHRHRNDEERRQRKREPGYRAAAAKPH